MKSRGTVRRRSWIQCAAGLFLLLLVLNPRFSEAAGPLDSPAAPDSVSSAVYTLDDIYNRLTTGVAGAKRTGAFTEPSAGPGPVGRSTDEIMGVAPTADDVNGAAPGQVLDGTTYWGLRTDGTWGHQTGTMPNNGTATFSPGASAVPVPAGYYSGGQVNGDADLVSGNIRNGVDIFGVAGDPNVADTSTGDAALGDILSGKKAWVDGTELTGTMPNNGTAAFPPGASAVPVPAGYYSGGQVNGDADLVSGNIRSGIDIFGVTGDPNVVDTSTGDAVAGDILLGKKAWVDGAEVTGTAYPAKVAKTGQTTCYDASGAVISCIGTGQDGDPQKGVAWPTPRFTDNGDGTVTDNLTDLVWLKKANCGGTKKWIDAMPFANALYDGWTGDGTGGDCTLSDGSIAGEWRLPNVKEFASLFDFGYFSPALSNAAGTGHWTEGDPFLGVEANLYWTASSYVGTPTNAWFVYLVSGVVNLGAKSAAYYVWPVRDAR